MHKASSSRPPESLNLDLLNLVLHNAYLCHAMMFLSFELLLELLFELLQMTPGRSSTQYKKECYIFTSWLLGGFDFFFRMGLEPRDERHLKRRFCVCFSLQKLKTTQYKQCGWPEYRHFEESLMKLRKYRIY